MTHPLILKKMVHTFSYKTVSSQDFRGTPTLSSVSTGSCFLQKVDEVLENGPNHTVYVAHKLWTTTAITQNTYVWLPGADTSAIAEGYKPERIKAYYTTSGTVDHYEIWLGSV